MTVYYEVNLEVESDIAEDFGRWLPKHVDEIIDIPGFVSAVFAREETDDEDKVRWSVRYRLIDRDALDDYLEQHAEAMREKAKDEFGDRFSAWRRVLVEPQRLPREKSGDE